MPSLPSGPGRLLHTLLVAAAAVALLQAPGAAAQACTTDCGGCTDAACFCRLKGDGVRLNPFDTTCGSFLQCSKGVAFRTACGAGTRFNPATLGCDWAANVNCNYCCGEALWEGPVVRSIMRMKHGSAWQR